MHQNEGEYQAKPKKPWPEVKTLDQAAAGQWVEVAWITGWAAVQIAWNRDGWVMVRGIGEPPRQGPFQLPGKLKARNTEPRKRVFHDTWGIPPQQEPRSASPRPSEPPTEAQSLLF